MSIATALYSRLSSDAGITAITSRIYPLAAKQGASVPYVVYSQTGNRHVHHFGGAAGLAAPRFQISCWDDDYIGARALAEQVRDAMDGYRGTMGGGGNTANVRGCFLEFDIDVYEPPTDAQKFGMYGVHMEFEIWHVESLPGL